MNTLRTFLALAACVALPPCAPKADAGTGVNTSPYDATVDTRDLAAIPSVTVTMHRVKAEVIENALSSAGIDDALGVKGTNRTALAGQPAMSGEMNPPWWAVKQARGGLVADGVTPLLFKVEVSGALPASFEVSLKSVGRGRFTGVGGANVPALWALNDSAFRRLPFFTATAQQPTGFVMLPQVSPEQIDSTDDSKTPPEYDPVVMDLEVRQIGEPDKVLAKFRFGIRKPPIVLLHGYNSDWMTWSPQFLAQLYGDRGLDFIPIVQYGTETVNGTRLNTIMRLRDLIGVLDGTLDDPLQSDVHLSAIAGPWSANWTFSRYDVIGHSQGGVLARLLCSSEVVTGSPCPQLLPFKSKVNHYRGRFRRVVTVGSPHVGSTTCELALKMIGTDANWKTIELWLADRLGYPREDLFQEKFRIGNDSELAGLNESLPCDPDARIHMIWATVDDGQAPGHPGLDHPFYSALYLNEAMPEIAGLRPGDVVAPNGADGVVPVESQGKGWAAPNKSSTLPGNFSHAALPVTETASPAIANRALALLNGPASEFGRVVIPETVTGDMETARARIAMLAPQLVAAHYRQEPTLPIFRNAVSAFIGGAAAKRVANSAPGDETLNFILEPLVDEAVAGAAMWLAENYGPNGLTSTGLTLTPSGTNASELALTVAASVQGTVVLRASYPSATGKTVFGQPVVVLTRLPGTSITGIELRPSVVTSPYGTKLPLEVWAIYDGITASRVYVTAANTAFATSNGAVVTVDATGLASMVAPGAATVTASYDNQWSAQSAVTVLDNPPVVTSGASAAGAVGQALTYQITASQAVQTFAAAPLPPGLTLNAQTGLISGTPTAQGATAVVASVANANGTGSKQVEFVITGPPGAPTDVGLDAGGVSEQKPSGTLVGRLTTADPNPLDTFTYQFVAGTGDTDNASFSITGDQLFTSAVLNRATQSTVSIRVRTVDSSAASFEKAIVLPVMAPPAITRQPDPQRVFAGDRALFVVEASGLEPLSYQWKRDDVEVPGESGRILEFAPADPSDAGSYTVTVSNGDGTATSTAVSLIVDPASYEKWLSLVPNATGGPVYEPLGDFNQDGLRNFLEFAFGVAPGAGSGLGAQPFVTHDVIGPVFTYYAANGIEPLNYRILKSGDMAAWAEHFPAPGEVTAINHGGYTEVQVRVPWAEPKMFLKLEVGTQ